MDIPVSSIVIYKFAKITKNEHKKVKDKHKDYHDSLMYFGSIKKIYLDRMLNKNKKKGE